MLEANKSAWFEKVFAVYNRNLLKRRFNSLQISGLQFLRNENSSHPFVLYANHSGWWDGLVAFELSRLAGLDSFIMMEEKHLKKLRFFRRLGAFSVVRENPREALNSLKYATKLLKENSGSALWIFPQGEILPNDSRPLRFYNGLARIVLHLQNCSVISLAIRYEFLGAYKPDIFVKINKAEIKPAEKCVKPQQLSNKLSDFLTVNLDRLKSDILQSELSDYEKIF
jgi:chlorobactene lauroyltransferase